LVEKAKKGKAVPEPFGYINNYAELIQLKARITTVEDLLNLDLLEEAMQVRAALYIRDVFSKIASSTAPDKTRDNEMLAQQKLPMMESHFDSVSVRLFRERVKGDIARGALKDAENTRLLEVMVKIFILESLQKDNGILFGAGYMAPAAYT